MWRAGLVQASENDLQYTRGGSPAPSIRSARSMSSSAMTEGRRAKLMELLSEQNQAPKRKVSRGHQGHRGHRGPRVRKGPAELRKSAMNRSMEARLKRNQREAIRDAKMGISRSTGSLKLTREKERRRQVGADRGHNESVNSNMGSSNEAFDRRAPQLSQNTINEGLNSSRRGATVVLPETVFFNGMNCVERPHWSVVECGMANGEDQTLSLSMWLSPSTSLRLKKSNLGRSDAARMKSSLSQQAAAGRRELSISSGGMTQNAATGDWYVVVNRRRPHGSNPAVQAINRMLNSDNQVQQTENSHSHSGGVAFGSSPKAPTVGSLAQHQLDAAILGADFSVSGASTPQISIHGNTGALKVTAQYQRPADGVEEVNNVGHRSRLVERSLTSMSKCPFGKWTHVVVVICGSVIRLYMDGNLDSQMFLPGPVHMPRDASLYIGRSQSVPDTTMSQATITEAENLGFVGFLAHAIVHARALDKLGIEAMSSAPRPVLPCEQDEWSVLSAYESARDRKAKVEMRRKKIMQQQEARKVLDEQVAYNQRMRAKAKEDEILADQKHLSQYGAMADQLKSIQRKEAQHKLEKARRELEMQRAVQAERDRAIQEQQMAEEIQEVRLLQRQVQKHRQDEETARVRAAEQAKREAREYHELLLKREAEKERKRRLAMEEREAAEKEANEYRAQMTARKTARRQRHMEYRAALDAQVDKKYSARTGVYHLSPTERSLNKSMLVRMAAMQAASQSDETSSQWNGSQYSMSFGKSPSGKSGRKSPVGGMHHVRAAGMRSGPRGLSSGRTGIVTRAEITELLDG